MNSPNCYLCSDLVGDVKGSGIAQIYGEETLQRSVLWESAEFYITPAPGTLALGYLILAPKEHIYSFARLTKSQLWKVGSIISHVSHLGCQLNLAPYVVFEHGSVSLYSRGGACVEHAHLHLVPAPDFEGLRQALLAAFTETPLGNIVDLCGWPKDLPYVLLGNQGALYCYGAPDAPSQFLRRVLARQLNLERFWNWRLHSFEENFNGTIQLLSGRFESFEL